MSDVFRTHGFDTHLTQQTRDGGVDIFVFYHGRKNIHALVECKRYAKNQTVGIAVVQRLIGVAVAWDTRKAYLVTSSNFSHDAIKATDVYRSRGYELDLVEATELAKFLEVYNEALPPLDKVDPDVLRRVVANDPPKPYGTIQEFYQKFLIK